MGHGLIPPASDLGDSVNIDDGTLARAESPAPGPVGLDAKSGTSKQTQASLADQIVSFPRQRRGQRVGDGECFTLADQALGNAGAKSAGQYGTVVPDADYVWGTAVTLADVRRGDVIQFRDYRYDREVETRGSGGAVVTEEDFQERPHHTAIVESVGGNGAITVLEQNSPTGGPVVRSQLFFSNGHWSEGNRTTTVKVQGTFWFYRPEAR